jgi:putative transposase
MLSAAKYRIYPKLEQEMRLKRSLLALCSLYNRLRAKKIETYRLESFSLTRTDLRAIALEERRNDPELQSLYSQVAQNVADRVAVGFKNFFEGRARFPKNKQSRKYLSMTYPQSGFKIRPDKKLYLSGIGPVRIFMHRPLLGEVERLTIKRDAGEWYAIFITQRDTPSKPPIDTVPEERIRGVDLGLEKFATLDNADDADYPEFLRQSENKIKTLQRSLAHKRKGSKRRRRTCFSLARLHLHVKRQREDWRNKRISEIFAENAALVLEKLSVEGLRKNHCLAKSISDAAFGRFVGKAEFKAQLLGKHFVPVDLWGTTQFCHSCLTWVPKRLAERDHLCPNCRVKLPRDLNSALLIRRLGILSRPPSDGGLSPAEPKPLPSLRGLVSQSVEAGSHQF